MHAAARVARNAKSAWQRSRGIACGLRRSCDVEKGKPQPLRVSRTTSFRRELASLQSTTYYEPTIYALSTAPGRAAIAVIRISGPACQHVYSSLCPGKIQPEPRKAIVRTLYEPHKPPSRDTVLDSSALMLYFEGPTTATGEDVLELHIHGGPAIVRAVLTAVSRCVGPSAGIIRYAEPGEFTRRAFMNNRLDLTQVEALGDTLAADTEQQRRLSVRGTTGTLAKRYEEWRQQLLYARGELEALIDFSEDQHFDESPGELMSSVSKQVKVLQALLRVHGQNAMRGELLRHGISVSLLGAPNAGKSSLLNRIVGREAAIVSNEAGTTRDVVEISLDLGGYLCRFGDTAGLRKAIEADLGSTQSALQISHIEQEGMRRAKARAEQSDVVVVVFSFEVDAAGNLLLNLDPEVIEMAQRLMCEKDNVLVVLNKADLVNDHVNLQEQAIQQVCERLPRIDRTAIYLISCLESDKQHTLIQSFLEGLVTAFGTLTSALTPYDATEAEEQDLSVWQESLGASERHRVLLEHSMKHLDDFISEAEGNRSDNEEADIVLAAEHLRAAAECLAKITGKGEAGDVEEVLGVVFEKFCVGK